MTVPAAIAAPNLAAAHAGRAVAHAGGNAVDIALAAMLTAMTNEPGLVSSMGSAFITVWTAGEEPEVIDGNVVMAGLGRPRSAFGGGLHEVTSTYGGACDSWPVTARSPCPGRGRAWAPPTSGTAESTGPRCWPRDRAGARGLPARAGCRDLPRARRARHLRVVRGQRRPARARGRVAEAGELIRDEPLAQTYEHIARVGWRDVYTGDIGRRMVADMDAHGGLVSTQDLERFAAQVRDPFASTSARGTSRRTRRPRSAGRCWRSCSARSRGARGRTGRTSSTSSAGSSATASGITT
ncbi:gamma-glutamyltransferase [Janibacter melonis]|uniref:gamma-glutamyltransferase n=1 Tax=Janibacter melonis TaxID=262209 RepID=UPI0027DA065E|nr:gamma-glutamyltransferase [Janibacter melonis]